MKYIPFFCLNQVFKIQCVSQIAQGMSIRTSPLSGAPNHAGPWLPHWSGQPVGSSVRELRLLSLSPSHPPGLWSHH